MKQGRYNVSTRNAHSAARDTNRRNIERRSHIRRVIPHAFGSEQWVTAIQADYLLWPRSDRRHGERRLESRRVLERRAQLGKYRRKSLRHTSRRPGVEKHILTAEEKSMLRELYSRS